MNKNETPGSMVRSLPDVHVGEEQDPYEQLYASRLVGSEKWQAEALLTEQGVAIGYTGRFRPKKEGPHRRVKLGYAMAVVKEEDTELLPLGLGGTMAPEDQWTPH